MVPFWADYNVQDCLRILDDPPPCAKSVRKWIASRLCGISVARLANGATLNSREHIGYALSAGHMESRIGELGEIRKRFREVTVLHP